MNGPGQGMEGEGEDAYIAIWVVRHTDQTSQPLGPEEKEKEKEKRLPRATMRTKYF